MFISICLSSRRPTSDNEGFASSSFVDFNIVVTIFAVYFCNFCLISFPLFTGLVHFTCVDECVLRYIFSTNIRCSKIVNLRWIKSIEFCYSWTICIHDFRDTFHVVVVCSTLKFDKFLSNNTFTKDTWSFLSCICCRSYRFVTSNVTVSWSCELLPCKTCLRIACKNCFISSWFVWLTFCVFATVNDFIVSCLIGFCIRNRSLNVLFVFTFVTRIVSITDLKCFILKVSINQWEGHVTWISSVSSCVCQSVRYIRVIVGDVAWKRDVAFSSFDCTSEYFWTIRFLHNTQVNIWISWKATCDSWTVNCKCSVVIKVCFRTSSVVSFKELPYTESKAICVWIQSITSFVEGCIFNRCTIRIWNNWVSIDATSSACWDWSQLCWNGWSTIHCCITSKACCSQGCHHVIYWLAQTFALVCVWLSGCISIDQAVACCQFCLNFSDGRIKCCFLLWSWYSCWVVSCNLVQQCCFWSVLFQNNFIFSFRYCCSAFYTCFRASCYSWFAWSCWKFCWTLFAQWSWVRYRYACRGWSTCRCRSASWFCCWLSCWFCCWFRLRFCCWSCTKYCTSLFYKSFTWKLRCSRNVWSCFICFCSIRYCSCTENSPCCYDPFEQATACHFFHWYCVFTHFSYNSLFDLTTNDLQKTKVRSRSTQPVFTWFDQFETSHTIRFTEFTVRTFKKHFCLLITFFISLTL